MRETIRDSWQRSRRHGIRPDRHLPPIELHDDLVGDLRREHPLARVWPMLCDTMRSVTSEPGNLIFASDADGRLLWMDGSNTDLRRAERVNLVLGARWSEEAAGTSGVGTALALRRPFQVQGAEHYLSAVTAYTCTAAPIRDPMTGASLGTIDLTHATKHSDAMVLSLMTTVARLAEAELRTIALQQQARTHARYGERLSRWSGTHSALVTADGQVVHAAPHGWLPARLPAALDEGQLVLPTGQAVIAERLAPGGPFLLVAHETDADQVLSLEALGRDRARLRVAGMTHELGGRHSELLTVLAANPGGLGADELRREVYGDAGKAVTLRAELARLRSVLGHRLASEPYRLTGQVAADFLDLDAAVVRDAPSTLLDRYPGPLLPKSAAPGVVMLRARLHERLRARLLAAGDVDTLLRWLNTRHGRADAEVIRSLDRLHG
ncbi:GAF domain-containing protein [Actinoallomurus iriomotensis]|uniref:GAF domain-containing protein n=1 Tax=Actinoallomurus iriomotensis TaxID=478107 RepID=UPI00255469C6|nr:GAF domain-containing protein [Actinoallomurus iriomotensis]